MCVFLSFADNGGMFGDYFLVNETTGEITLNKSIDREVTGDSMLGHVVVTDRGTPPKSSSAALQVTVTDINDNGPRFLEPSLALTVNEVGLSLTVNEVGLSLTVNEVGLSLTVNEEGFNDSDGKKKKNRKQR